MERRNNPRYVGQPTPKHLKHGPIDDRRCTDVLCLTIFFVFWAGIAAVAFLAFTTGDPMALTYAYDQKGRACGVGPQSDYPYLLFILPDASDSTDTDQFDISNTICVSECPATVPLTAEEQRDFQCYTADMTDVSPSDCDNFANYSTAPFVGRFCVPTDSTLLGGFFNLQSLDFSFLFKAVADLKMTWWMIIVVAAFALVLGFMYLLLMKYFSGAVLWALLVSTILLLTGFGIVCLTGAQGSDDLDVFTPAALIAIDPFLLYAIAVACFVIAFVGLVAICCWRDRINLSVAVLKASAGFIEEETTTLLIPPLMFVKSVAFYVGWVFIAVYIVGMNEITPDSKNHYPIANIDWGTENVTMLVYHFFGLFWGHAFGVGVSQFVIASAACIWYFSQGRANIRQPVVWTSIKRAVLHMGSIAFGSFLIGLLDVVRMILDFFNRHFNEEDHNGQRGYCQMVCQCCFNCFERFLKFITNHTYIQIAMTGEGFCQASEDAFNLLARNFARFGLVHGFAWLFLVIGQLFITLIATFLGNLIITQNSAFSAKLYSPLAPTLIFALISWLVADVFMAVYGVSADAIIHCFAMDEEIHDGNAQHAPQELKDFIDENAQKKLLSDYD